MLEGKYFCIFDMVFPFVAGFVDRTAVLTEDAPMTELHTIYSNLIVF